MGLARSTAAPTTSALIYPYASSVARIRFGLKSKGVAKSRASAAAAMVKTNAHPALTSVLHAVEWYAMIKRKKHVKSPPWSTHPSRTACEADAFVHREPQGP